MERIRGNIANVSWGDHIEFCQGAGRLATPDDIAAGVERWRERDGAGAILWRDSRRYASRYSRPMPRPGTPPRASSSRLGAIAMDECAEVVRRGHEQGMAVYLYVVIFDDGWPGEEDWPWYPGWGRQSIFSLEHPEHLMVDRQGRERHWGLLSYNEPEVRDYRVKVILDLVGDDAFDGVFVCTRSQSRPAPHGDQFGFNAAAVKGFQARYGVDPRQEPFDLDAWRVLLGEGLTHLLRELRLALQARGLRLAIGIPRGDYMGPPIGNLRLDWRTWLGEGLVDELIVGQISEVCPSTWVHMWPESPVSGYLLDPVRGVGMRPLATDLDDRFGPACAEAGVSLYLSRLHDHNDPTVEGPILAEHSSLSGLVFSTFRRDNPDVVREQTWLRVLRQPEGRNSWDPDRGLVRPVAAV